MHAHHRPLPHARLNTYHGTKRQLLGNHAGQAPPAWRTSVPATAAQNAVGGRVVEGKTVIMDRGSKIFISKLPVDVGEKEVEELFRKTVGPLRESFIVYNSQGKSKGMAVVSFQRPTDAAAARAKYDGKIVDGRRPIKIEVVVDDTPSRSTPAHQAPPQSLSLLSRLGAKPIIPQAKIGPAPAIVTPSAPRQATHLKAPRPAYVVPTPAAPIPPRKLRQKKGPRRIKKYLHKTVDQLDKEMEDYRAAADVLGI